MDQETTRREPALQAPWPAIALVGLMVGAYALQALAGGGEDAALRYGFTPADLDRGLYTPLVTHQFIHGGLAHLTVNALFALATAAPVSRLLGVRAAGAVSLLLFYLVCGVAGALAYAAFHPHTADTFLIGASGAVSGLFGAAVRLLGRHGRLAPLADRQVLVMAAAIMAANVVLGVIGFAPGSGPVAVAWEAHLGGFVAGLLLIGPWARVMRRI